MNKRLFAFTLVATTVAINAALMPSALAWHPKGTIIKKVQNQTAKSALLDANDAQTAVAAQPGDVLRYVIEVRNDGQAAEQNFNDMADTVVTDTLPAGVELVNSPAQRAISVNLGTVKPGQTVAKEYAVKVTATTPTIITNKACFTGNSAAHDNPQQGCDPAVVKVTVPAVPTPPKTPETPVVQTVATTPTPTTLPNTGTGSNILAIVGTSVLLGYAIRLTTLRHRANTAR